MTASTLAAMPSRGPLGQASGPGPPPALLWPDKSHPGSRILLGPLPPQLETRKDMKLGLLSLSPDCIKGRSLLVVWCLQIWGCGGEFPEQRKSLLVSQGSFWKWKPESLGPTLGLGLVSEKSAKIRSWLWLVSSVNEPLDHYYFFKGINQIY